MYFTNVLTAFTALASLAMATPSPSPIESGLEERTSSSFKCPNTMSYCPWTKACACKPGKHWDQKKGCCVGDEYKGAWPKPSVDVYASVDVKLGAYCARSPYKIVKYNSKHAYCQAGLNTVTFLASVGIDAEIKLLGAEIDVDADISVALKNVCAGLAGLYLESVVDAVALFNTNKYGYGVLPKDVIGAVTVGIFQTIKNVSCFLGLTKCNYDCVSYCTKGCGNYIDVVGQVGGYIKGLAGFCILPNVVLVVCATGKVVTHAIEGLLCIVGRVLESLLSTFNCGCN
ncbi:Fc.00g064780.m01.CDS01 [Cosmosporella sp. VM-42]